MDITVVASKSLAPACKAGDVWLHSPYDPEREAQRFVLSALGTSRPTHVILLGPCLDYLSSAVRSVLPLSRIVSVQYSAFFAGKERSAPDASWHPGLGSSLDAFLDANLDEDAVSGVAVLEWEPAARAFPAETFLAKKAVGSSLDRLNSSTATIKAFGKRWIANACASFLLIERALTVLPGEWPVVVAAAGPSLNASLELLSGSGGRFVMIAVSSALVACLKAGLAPDIVVSTDGGFWSRTHLHPLSGKGAVLASPLTALPSASLYRSNDLVLLDQGSFAESELLPRLGPSLSLPPHGTVSGTALYLASRITQGPIIAAGLDLASYGDLSHARPHGFDSFLAGSSSRLSPLEATLWSRGIDSAPERLSIEPWRSSRVLKAYASALSLDFRSLHGRIFRLLPSPQSLSAFDPIDAESLGYLMAKAPRREASLFAEAAILSPSDRRSVLAERLTAWRGLAADAAAGMGKGFMPEAPLVSELFRSIDIVDYAAARRAILGSGDPRPAASDLAARCDTFLSDLERRFSA
jgi:hypothetical protein